MIPSSMTELFLVVTLILLGFILLVIELFIIPGFGLVGIAGLLSMAGACSVAFARLSPETGVITGVVSITIIIFMIKLLPKTALWKKLSLETSNDKASGFSTAPEGLDKLVGKEGMTTTPLRPIGTATIDDKRYDVMIEMGSVDKGAKIRVIKVEGNRITVKKV